MVKYIPDVLLIVQEFIGTRSKVFEADTHTLSVIKLC